MAATATSSGRVVVLVCGLPAAGKSTLCRALDSRLRCQFSACHVEHLSFDEVLAQDGDSEASFSPERWRESRGRAVQACESFLQRPIAGDQVSSVLILDDNFYYRSMRRQFVRLCTAVSPPAMTLTVHLEVPLETALRRNLLREGSRRVPDSVIVRMHRRFEAPAVSSLQTLFLEGREDVDGTVLESHINQVISTLQLLVNTRMTTQVQHIADAFVRDLRCELDVGSRKLVSERMGQVAAEERAKVAGPFSSLRQRWLAKYKQQELDEQTLALALQELAQQLQNIQS